MGSIKIIPLQNGQFARVRLLPAEQSLTQYPVYRGSIFATDTEAAINKNALWDNIQWSEDGRCHYAIKDNQGVDFKEKTEC